MAVDLYRDALLVGDDIRNHLPTLKWLAARHGRVTEFGVRAGCSTIALLSGNPNVISYDIERSPNHDLIASEWPGWDFRLESTLDADIAETDMLFIDTVHTYPQLAAELALHADKVTGIICLHDTYVTEPGPVNDAGGMRRAVSEFIDQEGWHIVFDTPWSNGFTVLSR